MPKTKETKKLSDEDIMKEIKMLAEKSKETSSHQLDLLKDVDMGDEDIDTAFNVDRLDGTADPTLSHTLYYTMRRMMMDNLPKGKKNKKLREYVYNEKSLFLNRGIDKADNGIRGSDERQTYIDNFLKTAFDTVVEWVRTGANAFDLYMAFWKMNEEKSYHDKKEDKPEEEKKSSFDKQLQGLLNVPPPRKGK